MYLLIEHCNGEIMDDPFIIYNECDLEPFIDREYLIYCLTDNYNLELNDITISYLQKWEKIIENV